MGSIPIEPTNRLETLASFLLSHRSLSRQREKSYFDDQTLAEVRPPQQPVYPTDRRLALTVPQRQMAAEALAPDAGASAGRR
jgi:hypothetical protein